MNLQDAKEQAFAIRDYIRSHCEAVHVAGSIRREKPEVKDIELVVIPHYTTLSDPNDLFSEPTMPVNSLYQFVQNGIRADQGCPEVRWIKPSTKQVVPWHIKADGKYWRGYLPGYGIKLDLFLARFDNLGATLLIRTGSEDFGKAVMIHARRVGYRFDDGELKRANRNGGWEIVQTPDEGTVFRVLGLEYVPPAERTGPEALRRVAK